jgi:hypothetical protein
MELFVLKEGVMADLAIHPYVNPKPSWLPKESAYQYADTRLKFVLYSYQRPL